ncbi:hypothetical protein BTVI_32732 [Pitangus sulphuratus]|nr:hypothetical protein BTVI_32732 [Pitangus sulphuratus]
MLVQDTWTAQQSNMNCRTVDINIHVSPRVPILDEPLRRLLSDALSDLGCNILNARLNVVNSLLGSRNQMLPLGALGDLPPFSILSSDSIQLDLNLLSGNAEGGTVASTQQLPLAATLLLATGRPPRLSLSQDTLSTLLEQVQGQGALNLVITNWPMSSPSPLQGQVPESDSLTVSALFPFIPQLAQALPGSLPLELRVRMRDEPVVAVRDGRATVTLKTTLDVLIPALQTSQGLLFSLDVDIVLNVTPSVSDGKLQTSLALDSIKVTRFPQKLDPSTVSSLTEWLKQILMAVYVPGVNGFPPRDKMPSPILADAFHVSLPLPNVLNTSLRNAEVTITDVPGQEMPPFWCVILLGGLLPPSQGLLNLLNPKQATGGGQPGSGGLLGTGILGGEGLGKGILGGEGLGNGLLNNGLLGNGLLGNNSLLGDKGLLGTGLLGKGGLLGNGSLLGLNDLLGEAGGLLGGGNSQKMSLYAWLKVLNLENARVSWKVLHGSELVLNLYSKLVLRFPGIFNFLSGSSVETNITSHIAVTQDTPGDLKLVVKDCNNLFGGFSVNLRKGLLTNLVSSMLNSTLKSLVPALLCPLVNIWVRIININLQFLRVVSFGLLGKIYSALSKLPVTSEHFVELDLQDSPFPSTFIDWLLQSESVSSATLGIPTGVREPEQAS